MKKQTNKKSTKLRLEAEKIRELTPVKLEGVVGGANVPICRQSLACNG